MTYVKKNWQLYLFFLMPGLLLTIIFKYLPMGGLLIAFEDYNVIKGVLGSPWVGLETADRRKRVLRLHRFSTALCNFSNRGGNVVPNDYICKRVYGRKCSRV